MIDRKQFDSVYGEDAFSKSLRLVNRLAPITRDESWWASEEPYTIIGKFLKELKVQEHA